MKNELGKNYWFTYILMISSILSIIGTAQLLKLYHFNPDEHTTPAGQQDVIVIFNPDQMLNKTLFGLNIFFHSIFIILNSIIMYKNFTDKN